jgi:hypothetical protein
MGGVAIAEADPDRLIVPSGRGVEKVDHDFTIHSGELCAFSSGLFSYATTTANYQIVNRLSVVNSSTSSRALLSPGK